MSDALYLSLWYPNLRLAGLAEKLTAVLGEFVHHGGEPLVYSATVWPVSWHEAPVLQRVYGRMGGSGADPKLAVEEALELLHEDYAYEFQIGWNLWELETDRKAVADAAAPAAPAAPVAHLEARVADGHGDSNEVGVDPRWVLAPRLVRVTGFGPLFDEGAYEQDGHIRIDFGSDTPFLAENAELNSAAARHMESNIRQLVELTNAVEKASGATARLLWSELGESLAQKLAARLSHGN